EDQDEYHSCPLQTRTLSCSRCPFPGIPLHFSVYERCNDLRRTRTGQKHSGSPRHLQAKGYHALCTLQPAHLFLSKDSDHDRTASANYFARRSKPRDCSRLDITPDTLTEGTDSRSHQKLELGCLPRSNSRHFRRQ